MLCKAKPPFLLSLILYLLSGNDNLRERRKTKIEKRREPKRNDNLLAKIVVSFWCGRSLGSKTFRGTVLQTRVPSKERKPPAHRDLSLVTITKRVGNG